MLSQFLLYSKVNQPYIYMCLLFLGFPSYLGHHRALSCGPVVKTPSYQCRFDPGWGTKI